MIVNAEHKNMFIATHAEGDAYACVDGCAAKLGAAADGAQEEAPQPQAPRPDAVREGRVGTVMAVGGYQLIVVVEGSSAPRLPTTNYPLPILRKKERSYANSS
jgi:hypothetical protein